MDQEYGVIAVESGINLIDGNKTSILSAYLQAG